jgi:hypothetical protein
VLIGPAIGAHLGAAPAQPVLVLASWRVQLAFAGAASTSWASAAATTSSKTTNAGPTPNETPTGTVLSRTSDRTRIGELL